MMAQWWDGGMGGWHDAGARDGVEGGRDTRLKSIPQFPTILTNAPISLTIQLSLFAYTCTSTQCDL